MIFYHAVLNDSWESFAWLSAEERRSNEIMFGVSLLMVSSFNFPLRHSPLLHSPPPATSYSRDFVLMEPLFLHLNTVLTPSIHSTPSHLSSRLGQHLSWSWVAFQPFCVWGFKLKQTSVRTGEDTAVPLAYWSGGNDGNNKHLILLNMEPGKQTGLDRVCVCVCLWVQKHKHTHASRLWIS